MPMTKPKPAICRCERLTAILETLKIRIRHETQLINELRANDMAPYGANAYTKLILRRQRHQNRHNIVCAAIAERETWPRRRRIDA